MPTSFAITDAGLRAMIDRQSKAVEMRACFSSSGDDPPSPGYEIVDGVAVVDVHGALLPGDLDPFERWWLGALGYGNVQRALMAASLDARVDAIMLDVSSPGGAVEGLSGLIESMDACSKPIVAHASGEMCSAAYWLAAHADLLTADTTAVVGCLGCIVTVPKAFEGWSVEFISSTTPGKNADPETDIGISQYQALADDCGAVMFEQIAAARREPVEGLAERYGAGAVMVAKVAIERGMVDALTTTPIRYARALAGVPGQLQEITKMAKNHSSRLAVALAAAALADTDPEVETAAVEDEVSTSDDTDEGAEEPTIEKLQQENAALKEEIAELRRQLDEASSDDEDAEMERAAKAAGPAGATMLAAFKAQKAKRLEAQQAAELAACNSLFAAAVADGKTTPAAKKPLMRLFAADADAAVEFLETIPANTVVDFTRRGENDTTTQAHAGMSRAAAAEAIKAIARDKGIAYAAAKKDWIKENPGLAKSAGLAN